MLGLFLLVALVCPLCLPFVRCFVLSGLEKTERYVCVDITVTLRPWFSSGKCGDRWIRENAGDVVWGAGNTYSRTCHLETGDSRKLGKSGTTGGKAE